MKIPSLLWTWDHNVLARGVFAVLEVFLWALYCAIAYDTLEGRRGESFKLIRDHLSTTFFVGIILIPLAFLIWDEGGKWMLAGMLSVPLILALADAVRALLRQKSKSGTLAHNLRRVRRLRTSALRVHLDKQLSRFMSRQLVIGGSVLLYATTFAYYGVISGLTYTLQKETRIVFPQEKGKVAVFRTGEYWIVKSARRIDDILIVDEHSTLVKLDDPRYSSARMTERRYGLRVGGRAMEAKLGSFGAALIQGIGTEDIE